MNRLLRWAQWLGIQRTSGHVEQLVATLGGVVSLVSIGALTYVLVGLEGSLAVVPSMGAATVLLFAVPHGPLSQPWALFVGNGVSAVVGVSCAMWVDNLLLASGLAVGFSMGAMHLCRAIHPPGGATALAAVIGGEALRDLGYGYLWIPVLLNCSLIFFAAVIFNGLFPWRRYPASLIKYQKLPSMNVDTESLSAADFERASQDLGYGVDISSEQLQGLYLQAKLLQKKQLAENFTLELGAVYTNDQPGADWAVRQIIDHAAHPDITRELVIYKVLEGPNQHHVDSCSRQAFAAWAKQRLKPIKAP